MDSISIENAGAVQFSDCPDAVSIGSNVRLELGVHLRLRNDANVSIPIQIWAYIRRSSDDPEPLSEKIEEINLASHQTSEWIERTYSKSFQYGSAGRITAEGLCQVRWKEPQGGDKELDRGTTCTFAVR